MMRVKMTRVRIRIREKIVGESHSPRTRWRAQMMPKRLSATRYSVLQLLAQALLVLVLVLVPGRTAWHQANGVRSAWLPLASHARRRDYGSSRTMPRVLGRCGSALLPPC